MLQYKMKQNQLQSSEILLEPWDNGQDSTQFLATHNNHKILNPEKKAEGKHIQKDNRHPKRQMRYIKSNDKFNRKYDSIPVQIQQNFSLFEPSPKACLLNSSKNTNQYFRGQPQMNSSRMKDEFQKILGKMPIHTTYIGYFDGFDDFKHQKNNQTPEKKGSSPRRNKKTLEASRPSTTQSFYLHKKNNQVTNKSAVYGKTLEPSVDQKNKSQTDKLAKYTVHYQKILKLKENLRQRKKFQSHRKDEERKVNIGQTKIRAGFETAKSFKPRNNSAAQLNQLKYFQKSDYFQTVNSSRHHNIEATYTDQRICHEFRAYDRQQNSQKKRFKYRSRKPTSALNFAH